MVQGRFNRYLDGVRNELRASFTEESTPREIAASFSLGTFITMLPTLGIGLLVFVLLMYLCDRINKIALLASVLVFNPVVKWGVYVLSFLLGVFLLGPVEGVSLTDLSLSAGSDIVVRLLIGNLILAILVTVCSYLIVYRLAIRYQTTDIGETIDETLTEITDDVL